MTNLNRKGDCDVLIVVLMICAVFVFCGLHAQKEAKKAGRPSLGDTVVTKDFEGVVMKSYIIFEEDKYKYKIRKKDGSMTNVFWSEVTEVIKGTKK